MHLSTLLIFSLLCLFALSVNGLTLQVEPKTTECFYQQIPAERDVKLFYSVVRGGLLDILVQVKLDTPTGSPTPQILYEKLHFEGEEEGMYELKSQQEGIYAFCFNNEMARFTAKVIRFKIIVPDWEDSEGADPIEISGRRISEEMDLLELHQQYMRGREIRHRITQESTNSRVLWFSVLESLVLVSISIMQVILIRRFFNTKRHV